MKSNYKIDRNQFMMTSLDEMIDENSNVRVIDAYVQSLDVEKLGYQVYTNKVGRPAYNPKDMIGLYLYSYMSRVMSSRMMEHQTYINLEIMWLLNGAHPDHSTIAEPLGDEPLGDVHFLVSFLLKSRLGTYIFWYLFC